MKCKSDRRRSDVAAFQSDLSKKWGGERRTETTLLTKGNILSDINRTLRHAFDSSRVDGSLCRIIQGGSEQVGNSCEAHEKFDPENRLLSGDSPAKFFYSEKPLFMQKWIYGRDRSNKKFELTNRKTQTCRTQTSHQTIKVIYLHLQPNSNHKLE